jgi:hypothetical protein
MIVILNVSLPDNRVNFQQITSLMGGNEVTDAADKIEELKITISEESKGTGSSSVEEINAGSSANGEGDDDDDDQAQSQDAVPGNLSEKKKNTVHVVCALYFIIFYCI